MKIDKETKRKKEEEGAKTRKKIRTNKIDKKNRFSGSGSKRQ